METPHTDTVVEKTVAFVKDVLGIHPAPAVEAERDYPDAALDTAPEVTAEDAMRLDPNAFVVNPGGQITPANYANPTGETDAERLRRETGGALREKTALELNAESARAEEGR